MGGKLKEFVPIVFVNNLRQLRQDSGMSISEFADAVGVHIHDCLRGTGRTHTLCTYDD